MIFKHINKFLLTHILFFNFREGRIEFGEGKIEFREGRIHFRDGRMRFRDANIFNIINRFNIPT